MTKRINNRKVILLFLFVVLISTVQMYASESLHYVISKDKSGNIVATEEGKAEVVFSGTNAAKVINQAIQSIPKTQGGEIRIRSGEYELTESILIDRHGITISGDGRKTSTYGGASYMKALKDIDILVIRMDGERIRGITIRDISFYGTGTSNGKSGIHAIGCSDLLVISNVGVYQCETGIYLQGGSAGAVDAAQLQFIDPQQCGRGLVLEYCHYTKVFGGEFSDNKCRSLPEELQTGIYLTSNQYGITIGVKIIGITSVRCKGAGIRIGKDSYDISIQGGCDLGGNGTNGLFITNEGSPAGQNMPTSINVTGIICYNNSNAGMKVENADRVLITGCITSVNKHPHVKDAGQEYGILIGKGAENVMIHGNMSYNNSAEQINDETGKARIVDNF